MRELPISNRTKAPLPNGWGERTCLMGVINITPDSFSDGGEYLEITKALERFEFCLNNGADIIDIGAQSTRPGAIDIGPDEELSRLLEPLKAIRNEYPKALISIDTFHSKVANKALEIGANWINDISGGRYDNNILKVVADLGCPYVITHSRGNIEDMHSKVSYKNFLNELINEIYEYIELAIKAGISNNQIILDPGIGFSKKTEHNLSIIKNIHLIRSIGYPILIGPSRKRFIGEVLDEPDSNKRLMGTAAVVSKCVSSNIELVRVHDVKEMYQIIKMSESINI